MGITNLTDSDKQRLNITVLTESELHFMIPNSKGKEVVVEIGMDGDLTIAIEDSVVGYNGVLINKEQLDVLNRFLLKL